MKKITLTTLFFTLALSVYSLSFTEKIAKKGEKVSDIQAKEEGWSKELLTLINHHSRTSGWQPFFSETPNNTSIFAFEPDKKTEVAEIIKKFSEIKDKKKSIILMPDKKPYAIGYTTVLPKENSISLVLYISSQEKLSFWYKNLPEIKPGVRKFGKTIYKAEPKVSGPVLTLYLGNKNFDLDKLSLPKDIKIISGVTARFQKDNPESPIVKKIIRLTGD